MSVAKHPAELLRARITVFDWRQLYRVDLIVLGVVLMLAVMGIMNLYSTDNPLAGDTVAGSPHAWRQVRNLGIACLLATIVVCCDYRVLVSAAPYLYVLVVMMLVYVELTSEAVKGARSWVDFGDMKLQPSEPCKVVLVYMLAWYLAKIGPRIRKLPYFLLAFVIVGLPGVLVLKQPDLGTALTLAPLSIVMLYVAGCRLWHMLTLVSVGAVLVVAVILQVQGLLPMPEKFELKPHQKQRIMTFLYPDQAEETGAGWHVIQTQRAIGSGEMLGRGFRRAIQTNLNYVPEHRTDSIFVVLAEENGFVGCIVVLSLFGVLLMRGLYLARACPDPAGALLAVGCVTVLFCHVFINIAIAVGLMPVTGLPLPFLSYGGSFYVTVMLCVATMITINIKRSVFGPQKQTSRPGRAA